MSDHVPDGKSCPHFSTVQYVANSIALTGGGDHSPPQALRGVQGLGPGATMPGKHSVTLSGVIGYPNTVPEKMAAEVNAGRMKVSEIPAKYLGDTPTPISVPCLLAKCEKWCNEHNEKNCDAGCSQCQIAIMTKAFRAALASEECSPGLVEARKLPSKETQENHHD